MVGNLDHAWAMLEEAFAASQGVSEDTVVHSFVYSWRGIVARARGDLATARMMHDANIRVGHAMKNRTGLGLGLAFLAAVDLVEIGCDDAFNHFCDALAYHLDP